MSEQDTQITQPEVKDTVETTTVVDTVNKDPVHKVLKATPKPTVDNVISHTTMVEKFITGDVHRQFLVSTLEDYVQTMQPGKIIDDKVGATYQMRLWNLLKNLINREQSYDEFKSSWNVVISYFREHGQERKVFGARYATRFFHEWTGTQEEEFAFQKLIGLLHISIEKDRERTLRLINLDVMFAAGTIYTEEGRQRIFQYYRV